MNDTQADLNSSFAVQKPDTLTSYDDIQPNQLIDRNILTKHLKCHFVTLYLKSTILDVVRYLNCMF